MAAPQSPVFAPSHPLVVLLASALMGLGLLHLAELPRQVAQHGGVYFLAAWWLCLLVLALPMVLTEWLLGRRSRRSPIEGMAAHTRDADAKRGWRASAWGMTLAAVLAMAILALVSGGSANALVQALKLVDGTVQAAPTPAWILPTVAALLLCAAAGLCFLSAKWWQAVLAIGGLLALVLLLLPSFANSSMLALTYPAKLLTAGDWRVAARLALLASGAGLGVLWAMAGGLPAKHALGRLGLLWVLMQALLGGVLVLSLAPYVAVEQLKAAMAIDVVPTGLSVWLTQTGLLLLGLLLLTLLMQPVVAWLKERGLKPQIAVLAVLLVTLAVGAGLWAVLGAAGIKSAITALFVLLALVMAGQAVFAGWAMKVSHARKELNLPSEGIYNVWRVAVRLVLPLTLLWVVVGLVA